MALSADGRVTNTRRASWAFSEGVVVSELVVQEPLPPHGGDAGGARSTRRGALTAAAAGVGALFAANTLIAPTPARADHAGPVMLGHSNTTGDVTEIQAFGGVAFKGTSYQLFDVAHALEGLTSSNFPGSAGVYGVTHAFSGESAGVRGVAHGPATVGVYGETTAEGSDQAVAVKGSGRSGVGVLGDVAASNGVTTGVWGKCHSQVGQGVLAENDSTGWALLVRQNALVEGDMRVERDLRVGPPENPSFLVAPTAPIRNGQTAMWVTRNVEGAIALQRVEVGPPDSGGAGFRALRVPNSA